MLPSIYLPPNMTKLSLNCNVCVLMCDIVCVVLCVVKVFCVLLCVFFCVSLCVSMVLLCVSFCVSSLNRFIKHRHDTDVYTPFHGLYNRRAKGDAPLKPRTVAPFRKFYEL